MKYEDIVFLNKDYKFVKGSITVEDNIIANVKEYDYSNQIGIVPPFTDLHIHGGYGIDIMDCDANEMVYLSEKLLEDNVGMWLPTTVAKDFDSILNTAKVVKLASENNSGAKIAGIHIEGPFLSPKYKGIMEEKYILPCDTKLFDELKNILCDMVIRFTIAPEAENAEEFCEYVVKNGGYISMGHSGASAKQCKALADRGANSFTHIFNAMEPLHHRRENILSYALMYGKYCEIIADEIHIKPDILNLALNILQNRAVLITDALRPMGLGDGSFSFCGQNINVKNGVAQNANGTLAGSVLKLKSAVDNVSKYIGYENAIRLACENPARVIDKFDEIGSIEVGKKLYIL